MTTYQVTNKAKFDKKVKSLSMDELSSSENSRGQLIISGSLHLNGNCHTGEFSAREFESEFGFVLISE